MMMSPVSSWNNIKARLAKIFPPGIPNRDHSVWEIAAKTVFVMLYIDAVEGSERWLRPDQVTRMTDIQAQRTNDANRTAWAQESLRPGKGEIPGRWYAVNTRESIRDDTIRNSLIQNGAIIERQGLPTTSPAPRYALQKDFAALMDPDLDEAAFVAKANAWRENHLNAGALARIAIVRRGAIASDQGVLVSFPNGETRRMSTGQSADISKAVIEVFAPNFLELPGVIFLSESGNKVVTRDDVLAKSIGLTIPADKSLPDIVLVDLGPAHPLLIFVEVVWSDGPVSEARKVTLLKIAEGAGFSTQNVAFVTAFLDRSTQPFRKAASGLAWGSYAWFASEPEKLVIFSSKVTKIEGG